MWQRHLRRTGWAYVAFIWVMSLIPVTLPDVPDSDKIGHFMAYGLLAFWFGMLRPRQLLQTALLASLMGVAVEFAQALTPYRSFDPKDMLANAGGALLGIALAAALLRFGPAILRTSEEKQ